MGSRVSSDDELDDVTISNFVLSSATCAEKAEWWQEISRDLADCARTSYYLSDAARYLQTPMDSLILLTNAKQLNTKGRQLYSDIIAASVDSEDKSEISLNEAAIQLLHGLDNHDVYLRTFMRRYEGLLRGQIKELELQLSFLVASDVDESLTFEAVAVHNHTSWPMTFLEDFPQSLPVISTARPRAQTMGSMPKMWPQSGETIKQAGVNFQDSISQDTSRNVAYSYSPVAAVVPLSIDSNGATSTLNFRLSHKNPFVASFGEVQRGHGMMQSGFETNEEAPDADEAVISGRKPFTYRALIDGTNEVTENISDDEHHEPHERSKSWHIKGKKMARKLTDIRGDSEYSTEHKIDGSISTSELATATNSTIPDFELSARMDANLSLSPVQTHPGPSIRAQGRGLWSQVGYHATSLQVTQAVVSSRKQSESAVGPKPQTVRAIYGKTWSDVVGAPGLAGAGNLSLAMRLNQPTATRTSSPRGFGGGRSVALPDRYVRGQRGRVAVGSGIHADRERGSIARGVAVTSSMVPNLGATSAGTADAATLDESRTEDGALNSAWQVVERRNHHRGSSRGLERSRYR